MSESAPPKLKTLAAANNEVAELRKQIKSLQAQLPGHGPPAGGAPIRKIPPGTGGPPIAGDPPSMPASPGWSNPDRPEYYKNFSGESLIKMMRGEHDPRRQRLIREELRNWGI